MASHSLEAVVEELFRETLGLTKVGLDADFFAQGGSSLQAIQVALRLSDIIAKDLPADIVYAAPTVRSLAAYCERTAERSDPAGAPVSSAGQVVEVFPAAPQHLELLDREYWTEEDLHVRIFARAVGNLDARRLQDAFTETCACHEALRMRLVQSEGAYFFSCSALVGRFDLKVFDNASARGIDGWGHGQKSAFFDSFLGGMRLTRDALIMAAIVQTEDGSILLIKISHLIADMHAVRLLLSELEYCYRNPGTHRAEPPYKYRQFLVDSQVDRERSALFWRDHLDETEPRFLAQLDRSIPRENRPVTLAFRNEPVTPAAVRSACKALRVSEFSLLMSVFQIAVWRHSTADRVLTSSVFGGRLAAEQMDTIGSFSATVFFNTQISRSMTVEAVLKSVADHASRVYRHLDVSRRELQEFSKRDDLVAFSVLPMERSHERNVEGFFHSIDTLFRDRNQQAFDLSAKALVGESSITTRYKYCPERLPLSRVEEIASTYSGILTRLAADPRHTASSAIDDVAACATHGR